ncbi:arylesterase [Rhabdochromatium marinum]|uniref:arylesterase n=1 Tax=Rhabdochromatium marinum TaxID=48729 RepID=UPI001F5BE70F|nr:arylesterase [Rhabdochromatium marinum]
MMRRINQGADGRMMLTRVLLTGLVIIGLTALAGLAAAEPAAVRWLVLGDSLSAAYGLNIRDGWVAQLEQRLSQEGGCRTDDPESGVSSANGSAGGPGIEVINASISGETTAGGLERLPALLADDHPQAVIIALGANDGLRGFPMADIRERLVQLVLMARKAGASVLLLGVRLPPNYGAVYSEGFQRMYAEVAEQTGVALVPRMLEAVAERWDLMQEDGLHPTAAAQPMILDTLWPAMQEHLLRCD